MKNRFIAIFMLFAFVLGTSSACIVKKMPPGQIKKHMAPGQQKKHK